MSRLTRDGTAEPVSRDQILRRERGQVNINFPCSADHEQDWQPCPVDPSLAICVTIHSIISIPKKEGWKGLFHHLSLLIARRQGNCRRKQSPRHHVSHASHLCIKTLLLTSISINNKLPTKRGNKKTMPAQCHVNHTDSTAKSGFKENYERIYTF